MEIQTFSRKPYTVIYKDFHTGELKKIKRRPGEKQHDMLPTDIVELTFSKNDDWPEGNEYTIKHINPRYPNVLNLEDGEGNDTFVNYFDVEMVEEVADRGTARIDDPKKNKYLIWP